MSNWIVVAALLMLTAFAYQFGLLRSRKVASGTVRMHSRPGYYGMLVALWCGIPACTVFVLWLLFEPSIIRMLVIGQLPAELASMGMQEAQIFMRRVQALASGIGVSGEISAAERSAADHLAHLRSVGRMAMIAVIAALAVVGLVYAGSKIAPRATKSKSSSERCS